MFFFYGESDGESGGEVSLADWSNSTETKLTTSDKEASDILGQSISISDDGSTLAVGAHLEDPDGVDRAGSVYMFQNINGSWAEVQKLAASDKEALGFFGQSISIGGDGLTLIVGARGQDPGGIDGAGSAYVFQNINGIWTEVQKLTASDKEAGDTFGMFVSISNDNSTIVVGSPGKDLNGLTSAGSVYVFQNVNGVWTEVQKLIISDMEAYDNFGLKLSINNDGSIIVAGIEGRDSYTGCTYVFQNQSGTWTEVQKLIPSDIERGDRFGNSVSISDDGSTLVIGAQDEDPDGVDRAGSSYVFQIVNGVWTEVQKLTASDIESGDRFGNSVSINGDGSIIAVGSRYDGLTSAGSAYVFQIVNGSWTEVQKLTASDKQDSDDFGCDVSINGDGSIIAVGARLEDPDGVSNAGSVYVFDAS